MSGHFGTVDIIPNILIPKGGGVKIRQCSFCVWTYPAGDIDPKLVYCWPIVRDGGPALNRHCTNITRFLGYDLGARLTSQSAPLGQIDVGICQECRLILLVSACVVDGRVRRDNDPVPAETLDHQRANVWRRWPGDDPMFRFRWSRV